MPTGVFLFGASSMLGWSILQGTPTEVTRAADLTAFCNVNTRPRPFGVGHAIDLDDERSVVELFARERPRLIIQCAGVCDVENCEQSPEFAYGVNVEAMRILIAHAPPEARIVYCSSDHVFSGDTGPYHEDSPTDPISVYGRTRVAAEQLMLARPNTLIVRSGPWIGPSASGRSGHLDWLHYRTRRRLPMTVVSDEARSVVWAEDAARRVWALAESALTGIRHLTGGRSVSRPELASYLVERYAIGATFGVQLRRERRTPHLGRVELGTRYDDALAGALPAVVPALGP